jgi:lysophospholipase L1-like esterase
MIDYSGLDSSRLVADRRPASLPNNLSPNNLDQDAMARSNPVAVLSRAFSALGTVWLILGVTFVLLLVLEAGYRVFHATFHPGRRAQATGLNRPDFPYYGQGWYRAFAEGRDAALHDSSRYDAYRGWKLGSVTLPGLHVDSLGRRVTPQTADTSGRPRQVLMLGGSTMWGYSGRDTATIPSFVARDLARRGIRDVAVLNLALSGYNVTQEAVTLMLELRRGNVPTVVVALDGLNEAGAVLTGAAVGDLQDQDAADRLFLHRSLLADLIGHSEFLQWIVRRSATGRVPVEKAIGACGDVAAYYARVTQQVQALSRAYGFTTYFLHQPILAASKKPRTSWEQWLDGQQPEFNKVTAACGNSIDSAMAARGDSGFVSLQGFFDRDTTSVFVDYWGHLTEKANEVVAARIVELIAPTLEKPVKQAR